MKSRKTTTLKTPKNFVCEAGLHQLVGHNVLPGPTCRKCVDQHQLDIAVAKYLERAKRRAATVLRGGVNHQKNLDYQREYRNRPENKERMKLKAKLTQRRLRAARKNGEPIAPRGRPKLAGAALSASAIRAKESRRRAQQRYMQRVRHPDWVEKVVVVSKKEQTQRDKFAAMRGGDFNKLKGDERKAYLSWRKARPHG